MSTYYNKIYNKVLDLLEQREMTGKELRAKLNEGMYFWQKYSGIGFYAMMDGMCQAGLVEMLYTKIMMFDEKSGRHIEHLIREPWFRISNSERICRSMGKGT